MAEGINDFFNRFFLASGTFQSLSDICNVSTMIVDSSQCGGVCGWFQMKYHMTRPNNPVRLHLPSAVTNTGWISKAVAIVTIAFSKSPLVWKFYNTPSTSLTGHYKYDSTTVHNNNVYLIKVPYVCSVVHQTHT